jgi:hypothetical protein
MMQHDMRRWHATTKRRSPDDFAFFLALLGVGRVRGSGGVFPPLFGSKERDGRTAFAQPEIPLLDIIERAYVISV